MLINSSIFNFSLDFLYKNVYIFRVRGEMGGEKVYIFSDASCPKGNELRWGLVEREIYKEIYTKIVLFHEQVL